MYTMVSPTSQSENPESSRGPIERTIVDSRERARSILPPPLTGCDFVEIVPSTEGGEREKGRKREREKEREASVSLIVCQNLDRCTASPLHFSNVHPTETPREKHDPEISPGTHPPNPPIETSPNNPNTPENTSVEFNHINYE